MKYINKKLLIVIILLIINITAGSYAYWLWKVNPVEKMPHVVNLTKDEALSLLENKNVKIQYEYSDTVEKDYVITSNPETDEVINDTKIILTISKGQKITYINLPNFDNWSIDDVEKFAKDNELKYEIIEMEDIHDKGFIINITCDEKIKKGSALTVYISLGPKEVEEVKEEKVESNVVYVPKGLLNSSESEFIRKIKNLGLSPEKEEITMYSTLINSGCIWEYEDGNYTKGSTVKYKISIGPYQFDKNTLLNKTKNEAESTIKVLNDRYAHIDISFVEKANNDSVDKIFDCNHKKDGIQTKVTCYIGLKEVVQVETPKTEEPENNPPVVETPPITEEKPSVDNPPQEKEPEEKYYIPAGMVFDSMVFDTSSAAIEFLRSNTLSKFTNVTFKEESTRDYSVGCVYLVEVDGNSAYEPDYYVKDIPITVYVSKGF